MKKIYSLLLFVLCYSQLNANHLAAGTIYYEYLSPLTYKVHLLIYQDCGPTSSFAAGNPEVITVSSASTGQVLSIVVDTTGNNTRHIVPDMCPSIVNWCNDPTSIFPGYEEWHYSSIVTLPNAADDWEFVFNTCCRNAAISNLDNPVGLGYSISAKLNDLTSAGNMNNSTQFIVGNGFNYLVNQPYTIHQTAIDPDGDSLVFSLVSPQGNGAPCPYNTSGGFSVADPFGPTTATNYATIDPSTGNFNFESSLQGVYVVAIHIDEYRNGVWVGATMRDLQFNFINGGANSLPSLSGVNGSSNYHAYINVCSGSTLTFTVNGNDIDITDSVIITPLSTLMSGSTFTTNNALQQIGTFSWTPTVADIRPYPYFLVLQAKDNNCHSVTYGYLIHVNQCNTDSVWAGDANADFVVNNYDVLNIGIGNGTSGIVRPSATTNWVAESCSDWTNSFTSGINYKHADCNGDGIIDAIDMNAITLNYGQFHTKTSQIGTYKTAGLPDLYVDLTGVVAVPGSTLQIPIMLGTSSAMMNNIYGIAGHLNVSSLLSAPISLSNPISWLGTSSNLFLFQKNINPNDIAFTMVRNNQTSTNGSGQIGTLSIPLSTSAIVGSDMNITFSDLKFIDNNGAEITDYNVLNDTLKIDSPNGLNDQVVHDEILVYPNPMKDEISIQLKSLEFENVPVTIVDMKGNTVFNQELRGNIKHDLKINTSNLASGMYFIKIATSSETLVKKLMK